MDDKKLKSVKSTIFIVSGGLFSLSWWILYIARIDALENNYLEMQTRAYIPAFIEMVGIVLLMLVDMSSIQSESQGFPGQENGSRFLLILSIIAMFSGIIYSMIIFDEDYICLYCDPKSVFGGVAVIISTVAMATAGILSRAAIDLGTETETEM